MTTPRLKWAEAQYGYVRARVGQFVLSVGYALSGGGQSITISYNAPRGAKATTQEQAKRVAEDLLRAHLKEALEALDG